MTDDQKPTLLDGAVIQLELTVSQVNTVLNILAQAPYFTSAQLIPLIQAQTGPQVKRLMEAEKIVREAQAKNEG